MRPAVTVAATLFVVLPKVNDEMLVAAEVTTPPTSRRLKLLALVKPVSLKEVITTVPLVLIARPFVEVTLRTSA